MFADIRSFAKLSDANSWTSIYGGIHPCPHAPHACREVLDWVKGMRLSRVAVCFTPAVCRQMRRPDAQHLEQAREKERYAMR